MCTKPKEGNVTYRQSMAEEYFQSRIEDIQIRESAKTKLGSSLNKSMREIGVDAYVILLDPTDPSANE